MLAGLKPLSIFSFTEGHEADFVLRYLRLFDRHVAGSRIEKKRSSRRFHDFRTQDIIDWSTCFPGRTAR